MTSQLDERPAQTLTSSPNRIESRSRSRPWMLAAAAVAVLTLGAGLILAVDRTDGARSPADKPDQVEASVLGLNGGVLPAHLWEFEARVEADSLGRVLPAHLQEFEARVKAGSLGRGVLPAHLREFEAQVESGSLGGDES